MHLFFKMTKYILHPDFW